MKFGENTPKTYENLVRAEIDNGNNEKEAIQNVELALFNERISQFTEDDLTQDADGSWNTFEQKIRNVFPEFPEDRFKAIKAAVSMELCGL